MNRLSPVLLVAILLSACQSTTMANQEGTYTPPEQSGLSAIRPYPNANDVCEVIGENEKSAAYLDDSALLIGCPDHETGAIADRLREGGKVVGQVGSWTLLSIPVR